MKTKLIYNVDKEEVYDYDKHKRKNIIVGRYYELYINGKYFDDNDHNRITKEEENLFYDFLEYIRNNTEYELKTDDIDCGCTIYLDDEDCIQEQKEEIKKLYKEWKIKNRI